MSNIATKLTYLNGTKQAIKQAINEDFEVIDDNTTFREYADEISSNNAKYKDLIPKETKNATNTLDISDSANLKALVTQYGNTYQETTTGKNLLKNTGTSTIQNGLTYTVNSDGTFTINGTATSTTYYKITNSFTFNNGVTYMMSGCPSGGTSRSYYIIHNASPWNTDYGTGTLVNGTGETASIEVVVVGGTTCNNLLFKPQIELGSTKTSYEPYTNGQSPNPDYPQDIQVVSGDNTIKVEGANLVSSYRNATGTGQFWAALYVKANLKPNAFYEVSFIDNSTGNDYTRNESLAASVSSYSIISNGERQYYSFKTKDNISPDGNGEYLIFKNNKAQSQAPQFTNVDIREVAQLTTESFDYEPYQSASYPVNLGSMELCKISTYKDRIYPLNGKWYLEKKIGKVVLDGSENNWGIASSLRPTFFLNTFNDKVSGTSNFICDKFSYKGNAQQQTLGYAMSFNIDTFSNFMYIQVPSNIVPIQDVVSFKVWLSNNITTVRYPLATPTNEEITESNYPTLYNQLNNIKLYEGVNHITMTNESGLDVEFDIEYYKDWKLD